jgi:ABC-type glycerol-3-phosphate transport system substrate-binding protein
MKKLTTLLLVSVVTLLLTACGGGGSGASSDNRDTTTGGAPTTSGRLVLSWVAPSTRADGSYLPLTELEGYRIYYGSSADNLTMLVDLNDKDITEYTVDSLPSGNYYFAITVYDLDGYESRFSNIVNTDV